MSAKPFVLKALEMEAAEAPRGEAPPAAAAFVSARLSLYHNDFDGAAAELEAAVASSPKELEGWCLLGEAKLRGGDAAAAREAYGRRCPSRRPRWRRARCSAPRASPSPRRSR